jgi:hypothetical protein
MDSTSQPLSNDDRRRGPSVKNVSVITLGEDERPRFGIDGDGHGLAREVQGDACHGPRWPRICRYSSVPCIAGVLRAGPPAYPKHNSQPTQKCEEPHLLDYLLS